MKIKYLKFKNWLMVMMSGLLGINLGCESFADEYGCPEASYRVRGTVTNEDGQPVAGIGVNLVRDWNDEDGEWYYEDTTDADGKYSVGFFGFGITLDVDFHDIDPEQDGKYLDTTVSISTENVPLVGGDGRWNEGTGYITKDVTLKKG